MKLIKIFMAVLITVISLQFAKADAVTTAFCPALLQGPPPPPPGPPVFRHRHHHRYYRHHGRLNVHIHLPPHPPGPPPPPPGPPQ